MSKDTYKSIQSPSEGLFKDKGSKFISFAYPITSEEQAKSIVKELKKKFHNARHHCYAYCIGVECHDYRLNDDGEPSGTAGKPIFGQIQSNGLSDILIVVVRYFGGILLGTSGLINAYKNSAASAIENARFVEKIVKQKLDLQFSYELLSQAMRIIKDENLEIHSQQLTDTCRISIDVRESEFERIKGIFMNLYGVDVLN